MRILVTGSSGQLGAALCELLAEQHTLIGLDALPGKWTTHVGSVTDRDLICTLTRGVDAILHTASLHARHLSSHSRSDFVSTNMQGTLNLLEAAVERGVRRFVYTSTTSLYGHAMVSPDRAVWVSEVLPPEPRDIYDVTKIAAEGLLKITAEQHGLPCISLRVSRFFPEPENLMVLYRLYRGVDVRDAAWAHLLALQSDLPGFEAFNISARSPFAREDVEALFQDPRQVILKYHPSVEQEFRQRGWQFPERIDRVYSIEKAEKMLDYHPRFNFADSFQ